MEINQLGLRGSVPHRFISRNSYDDIDEYPGDPGKKHHYACPNNHLTIILFSETATPPLRWQCRSCSTMATSLAPEMTDQGASESTSTQPADVYTPAWPDSWVTESHLAKVHERRTTDELESLLSWARKRVPSRN